MNTPRYLMGAALLFWGWTTGTFLLALPMALVLEWSLWTQTKWDFGEKECSRVWDICVILTAITMVYCFSISDGQSVVVDLLKSINVNGQNPRITADLNYHVYFFQWIPFVLFPFMLVQAYGSLKQHRMPTFFLTLRMASRRDSDFANRELNFSWIYFLSVLLAAASSNMRDMVFFAGFCVLVGWGMYFNRPKRVHWVVWWALFALVVKLGHHGHQGIMLGQQKLEHMFADMLSQMGRAKTDPGKSITAIGERGRLKMSGKILGRVKAPDGAPTYLREASFSVFRGRSWYLGTDGQFEEVEAEADTFTWVLDRQLRTTNSIEISVYKAGEETVLPVPSGTGRLGDFAADGVRLNRYASVQTVEGPLLLQYRTDYDLNHSIDSLPTDEDLILPENIQGTFARVGDEIGLGGGDELAEIGKISRFFAANFNYTLWQPKAMRRPPRGLSAIEYFLTERRAGHCEYFATATVLMLRQAGIPARYAVGYAVDELVDAEEGEYVIRGRHGHAWVIYYSEAEKRWINFDTTPGSWLDQEREEYRSPFEPISDFFSSMKHGFLVWRYGERSGRAQQIMMGVLILLVAILVWRIVKGRRRLSSDGESGGLLDVPGLDSELYALEQWLQSQGFGRRNGETIRLWKERLKELGVSRADSLDGIIDIHYRYRFDPAGIEESERATLAMRVRDWLDASKKAEQAG